MLRTLVMLTLSSSLFAAGPIKVLIVDGQNNHNWKATTPVLKQQLEASGRFRVDVATTPEKGGDMSAFHPNFAAYDVVLSNYNGEPWTKETNDAFEKFVRTGGGFVSYHAADNSFPEWKEYNDMIAVGGWERRNTPTAGAMIHFRDGKPVLDTQPHACGNHGARLPFPVTIRDTHHPVTKGMPETWMHAGDELYDSLCGPAKNFDLLATAPSLTTNRGTGENEPMLMTITYGKGRVFHTTLGHDVAAMQCVGFTTSLLRGVEWAATGKVTIKIPANFPTADAVSVN